MFKDQIKDAFATALDNFLENVISIIINHVEQEMLTSEEYPEPDTDVNDISPECENCSPEYSQDILMCFDKRGIPIYGTVEEITDSMPEELEGCFSFKDGIIYFGKYTAFETMKDLMDNINSLAKRIRPSRGKLTAPEFRQFMNEWRDNMIDDAAQKDNITLSI